MVDGVVMLLVGSDGHVWASVSDFDRSGYGGFTLAQAQEIRAKRALAYEYLRAVAHPHIAEAMDPMGAERIVGEVCRMHGHKIVTKLIGHDDTKESPAMDSAYALRLSCAARAAPPGRDFIDHGWSLVKALHAEGFDVVPREKVSRADRRETLNEMCGLDRKEGKA